VSVKRLAILLAVAAALAAVPPAAAASRTVPPLFYGANWDGEIEKNAPDGLRESESARMATHGVETTRVVFEWMLAQPERDGPFDFTVSDRVVRHAVAHGLDVLPVVILAPRWARQYRHVAHSPPKDFGDYNRYLRALIRRYGPAGSFWTENPMLPKRAIRRWQIWNEPHLQFQWSIPSGHDYAPGYGRLLRGAYRTVKATDRGAAVVLGGLSNFSWEYLDHLYEKGRIKGAFDVAALHPYTTKPSGVITLTKRFRIVMRRHGDRKKSIWITELGLPASRGRVESDNNLQTTDEGMAEYLEQSYRLLVKNRKSSLAGVKRVYWYNWASTYCCEVFRFTGLLKYDNAEGVEPMPALEEYRRSAQRYQGCQKDERAQCVPATPPPAP
jgi:hypothetical protein